MLRFLTAGESHGPAQIAILEGMPAGLTLSVPDIQKELEKRRSGSGRGGRGKIETDQVKILSGVRFGKTLGSPIALMVENKDFANWQEKMQITPQKSQGVNSTHTRCVLASHLGTITTPRPGHADLAGVLKYGFDDVRNILERASARETVMRTTVGAICKIFLKEFKVEIASHTIQIANIKNPCLRTQEISKRNFKKIRNIHKLDPLIHCLDKKISQKMAQTILEAQKNKDTLGGVVEVIAHNVPVGLGSHVHYDRKLDGRLAQHLMSIQSVKAVEIGEGIKSASCFGSEVHDEISYNQQKGFYRKTNRAGGIEGGISNGCDIICRIYLKPLSTLDKPLVSVDIKTKKPGLALVERSDICVIPRAGVIAEGVVAFVLAEAFLEKFGGDSMKEIRRNFDGYIELGSDLF